MRSSLSMARFLQDLQPLSCLRRHRRYRNRSLPTSGKHRGYSPAPGCLLGMEVDVRPALRRREPLSSRLSIVRRPD
jgi:hypothetical protein